MGKETEADGPPQPILIQGSSIIQPAEDPTTGSSTPSAATTPGQDPSTVEEALAKVQFLQDSKPNTNGLLAVGLLFFFAVPLLLFVGTDADIVFNDGIFICCFSIIIGIVLILLAESKQSAWKKSIKTAKSETLRMTNAPVAEAKKHRATYVLGAVLFVVGAMYDIFLFALIGALLLIPSGLAAMNHNTKVNQAFHRLQTGHQDTLHSEE